MLSLKVFILYSQSYMQSLFSIIIENKNLTRYSNKKKKEKNGTTLFVGFHHFQIHQSRNETFRRCALLITQDAIAFRAFTKILALGATRRRNILISSLMYTWMREWQGWGRFTDRNEKIDLVTPRVRGVGRNYPARDCDLSQQRAAQTDFQFGRWFLSACVQ